ADRRQQNGWVRATHVMGLFAIADQRAVIAFVDLRSEIAVVLALLHHLPAVSVKRVVDDPLGGVHRVIVLEAEMAETFRDGFKARRPVNLYFFKIASNEHSLPWCPNSTFFTS